MSGSAESQLFTVYQRKVKVKGRCMLETWQPVTGACSEADAKRWFDLSVRLEPREVFRVSPIKPRTKEVPQ